MADITMCQNKKCKRKMDCYRYIAIPNQYYQSYFIAKDDKKCENFIQANKLNKERYEERKRNEIK